MAWLVYIDAPRGPSPRIIHDGTPGRGPELSETERRYGVLAKFELGAGEERLPIAELTRRYPPPRPKGGDSPNDPGPTSPAPAKPRDGGGVARELEVA